jgi:hypothetical protein
MANLIDLIEEFQSIMKEIVELTEESRVRANQIPNLPIGEAAPKIDELMELCNHGMNAFQKASAKAEEIYDVLR